MFFHDRADAGRQLAEALEPLRGQDIVVLGLPRGGMPVAAEVARKLGAPLDVSVVRKMGVPGQPELAMGAVGETGLAVINRAIARLYRVTPQELIAAQDRARAEVRRLVQVWRPGRPPVDLTGRTAVLIDDGIATGATARAACRAARSRGAARVVLAAPIGAPDAVTALADVADEVVCPVRPPAFGAVGEFYGNFAPTRDEEVAALLDRARAHRPATAGSPPAAPAVAAAQDVIVTAGPASLAGQLTVPAGATGLVVFAHGSGSSHHSLRNQQVARTLNRAGLGTLLFDLLTPEEAVRRANVFDIGLLADRLIQAVAWVRARHTTARLPIGLFGASTGAAAALWAAADPASDIAAVVCRGGRLDLATTRLALVRAPTLLIVGSLDRFVLTVNRNAAARMRCAHRLAVVPGAAHLFEEPGALDAAARQATDWFTEHLAPRSEGTTRHPGGRLVREMGRTA